MSSAKGGGSGLKKCCIKNNGFISVYFLVVFLAVSACCAVAAYNDSNRLKAALFLQTNEIFFRQEAAVIYDVRCRMNEGDLSEGTYETGGISYEITRSGHDTYIEIHTAFPEMLMIRTDDETDMIIELETVREQGAIDSYLR